MWPDRRVIELLQIEHPIVLAPMVEIGTVELAASVCAAGGLGSIGCAAMQPELVAKKIQALRRLTHKPINVNFFCHVQAKADAEREQAWRDRLSPYYCELGIHSELPHPRVDVAPFDQAMCSVVEDAKPEVVSFHFGLPDSALLARLHAQFQWPSVSIAKSKPRRFHALSQLSNRVFAKSTTPTGIRKAGITNIIRRPNPRRRVLLRLRQETDQTLFLL
jgi:NAD(P)H-dependent flavin oxidoreductase YrpB (nitropropane dioxygenase family)